MKKLSRPFLMLYASVTVAIILGGPASHAAEGTKFFPPDNCPEGNIKVITWSGETGKNPACLQVPSCTGEKPYLNFTGEKFVCSGKSSAPAK